MTVMHVRSEIRVMHPVHAQEICHLNVMMEMNAPRIPVIPVTGVSQRQHLVRVMMEMPVLKPVSAAVESALPVTQ